MTTSTTGLRAKRAARAQAGRCAVRGRHAALRRKAFTLLELVLVMMIICTVLALAAPSLRGFFTSRETADAAAQITALTQLARSQAVSDGYPYRLSFDTQAGTYWLTVQKGGAFQPLGTEFGRAFRLPDGVQATLQNAVDQAPHAYIQFNVDGSQTPATIRLMDRQGDVMAVTCPSPTAPFTVVGSQEW
jgi:type II secretion system protein H